MGVRQRRHYENGFQLKVHPQRALDSKTLLRGFWGFAYLDVDSKATAQSSRLLDTGPLSGPLGTRSFRSGDPLGVFRMRIGAAQPDASRRRMRTHRVEGRRQRVRRPRKQILCEDSLDSFSCGHHYMNYEKARESFLKPLMWVIPAFV